MIPRPCSLHIYAFWIVVIIASGIPRPSSIQLRYSAYYPTKTVLHIAVCGQGVIIASTIVNWSYSHEANMCLIPAHTSTALKFTCLDAKSSAAVSYACIML